MICCANRSFSHLKTWNRIVFSSPPIAKLIPTGENERAHLIKKSMSIATASGPPIRMGIGQLSNSLSSISGKQTNFKFGSFFNCSTTDSPSGKEVVFSDFATVIKDRANERLLTYELWCDPIEGDSFQRFTVPQERLQHFRLGLLRIRVIPLKRKPDFSNIRHMSKDWEEFISEFAVGAFKSAQIREDWRNGFSRRGEGQALEKVITNKRRRRIKVVVSLKI